MVQWEANGRRKPWGEEWEVEEEIGRFVWKQLQPGMIRETLQVEMDC